jgi:hypothetical protein
MSKPWGALPKEWDRFIALKLTGDLLPVVCNPEAKIDPKSKMKKVGKTPSVYNQSGFVAGFGNWTEKTANDAQLRAWKKQSDYGLCIQTRRVRALDIDVPDEAQAERIKAYIQKKINRYIGASAPVRYRKDSGKCLVAFVVKGEFGKRTVRVEGGIIEFLANGQQFVAAGVHQAGERYKWDWQGVEEFPVLTLKQANKLWARVVAKFGIEEASEGGLRKGRSENSVSVPDETMDFLEKEGLVTSFGQEGQAFISCPFKDQHTAESVESATAYFPKGSRGYERGHFRCLHAHCADKKDVDFADALGITDSYFEPIVLTAEEEKRQLPAGLIRNKAGDIEATLHNLDLALSSAVMAGVKIGYDEFLAEEMIARVDSAGNVTAWRGFKDTDYTKLRRGLERRGFNPIGREMMRDAVKDHAETNMFDSAKIWIESLPKWDGIQRVKTFVPEYLGAKDTPYTQAVGFYLWSALAGRILQPGVKADMALILFGAQGAGKSTAIEYMAPTEEMFAKISLEEKDDDLSRKLRGVIVGELDELRGLNSRDSEWVKSFIARRFEKWIKKYEERTTMFPRRCIFLASTNHKQFLADDTGERRWLPFEVAAVKPIALEKIKADKVQLWAEAVALFMKHGVMWQDAEELARGEHDKFKVSDDRIELIRDWLEEDDMDQGKPCDKPYLYAVEVLQQALGYRPKEIRRGDEMAVGSMLKKLGYERKRKSIEGSLKWVYLRKNANSKKKYSDLA